MRTLGPTEPYAEVRETHSAVVFLVGEHAYKLKKPVDLGFLDFSTLEKRRQVCEDELRLNRRLAPDVYEGLSQVVGVDGAVVDHLLTMRRMPQHRRLTRLLESDVTEPGPGGNPGDLETVLDDLARLVADFHRRADRSDRIDRQGSRDAVAGRWQDNLAGTERFLGTVLDEEAVRGVVGLAGTYLAGREALFEHRIRTGCVLDGHGDLLAEDIFALADGIRVLDCLEFSDELRHLDRVDDLACLLMDLERLGAPAAATRVLDTYRSAAGECAPASLVHHYVAYRAFMRAKVACLPGAAGDGGQAGRLVDLAARHLDAGRVRLVMVGGAPGTGKSTTAAQLAALLDAELLSSDVVRKELAGVAPETSLASGFGAGVYTSGWTARTYRELTARAERAWASGRSVVIDATWSDGARRAELRAEAALADVEVVELCCAAPATVAEDRLAGRISASDADAEVARRIRAEFDPWPEAVDLDTVRPPNEVVAAALARAGPAPWFGARNRSGDR